MRGAALFLALLASLSFAGCSGTLPRCDRAGVEEGDDGWVRLCVEGREREARIEAPARNTSLPVLLMLHGGGGSADQFRAATGIAGPALEAGFLVVHAQGTPARRGSDARTWNAVHCCGEAFDVDAPDVEFLGRLLQFVLSTHEVDRGRVAVAGHSNGAMMAYRLASERSDLVSHVVAVAGAIGGEPVSGDPERRILPPARPVWVMVVHAADDPRVPYGGGEGENVDVPRTDLSVMEAVSFWREVDGVSRPPRSVHRTDGVEESWHEGGREGTGLRLLTTRGGHGWPGSAGGALNPAPGSPDASREIVAFVASTVRAG